MISVSELNESEASAAFSIRILWDMNVQDLPKRRQQLTEMAFVNIENEVTNDDSIVFDSLLFLLLDLFGCKRDRLHLLLLFLCVAPLLLLQLIDRRPSVVILVSLVSVVILITIVSSIIGSLLGIVIWPSGGIITSIIFALPLVPLISWVELLPDWSVLIVTMRSVKWFTVLIS